MKLEFSLLPVLILAASILDAFPQPVITRHPTNQSVSLGATATFRIAATTTNPPLALQWRLNSIVLSGRTNLLLSLTNVQLPRAGLYDVVVRDVSGSVTSRVVTLEVDPSFTKITSGSIVTDRGLTFACAWADYDNDDYVDLLVTNQDDRPNFLYRNQRDGTFRRVTEGEIATVRRDYRGIAWGDYDNDGFIDLYVSSTDGHGFIPWNYLYRNNGNGTFTSIPASIAGSLVGPNGGSEGCTWSDYDRDGFLDLFVARYGNDLLFRNNGNGSFTSITNSPMVKDAKNNYQAAWADFDNDGWPDLFTSAIDGGGHLFYHNNRDGSFTRLITGAIATDTLAHRPAPAWADYNNDGLQDLFIGGGGFGGNLLYRNDGNGTFSKITTGDLITTTGRLPQWGDYDNDGFLDVFLPRYDGLDNLLYRNNGDGTFTRVTSGSLVHDAGNSYQSGWADYDNDGFLDLFVTNDQESSFLYRNNGNSNHWLKVKLMGTVSNRSAIGATVRARAKIRGREMWQSRVISNGNGFGGTTLVAHFGLADATEIETLRIEWPSGTVQEFSGEGSNRLLTISEPPLLNLSQGANAALHLSITGGIGLSYSLETSSNLVTWTPWIALTNLSRITTVNNLTETTGSPLFYRAVAR